MKHKQKSNPLSKIISSLSCILFVSFIISTVSLFLLFCDTSFYSFCYDACFYNISSYAYADDATPSNKGNSHFLGKVFSELRRKRYWQVEFEEVVFDKTGILSRSHGTIKFVSPFTFEISYDDGRKRVLSDGELLFFVFPEKKKVFVKSITDEVSQNLIFDILSGTLDVPRYFSVERGERGVFLLFPKGKVFSDKVGKIKIKLMRFGFPIRSVEIVHRSGNMGVRLELKKVRYKKEKINFDFPDDYNFIFDINLSPQLMEKLKRKRESEK